MKINSLLHNILINAFLKSIYSYAAESPHLDFYILKTFKFIDFNKEPTRSLKMIWIMIETYWSVFKCFNINILD